MTWTQEFRAALQERDAIHVEIAKLQRRAASIGLVKTAARLGQMTRTRWEPPLQEPIDPLTVKVSPLEEKVIRWMVRQSEERGFYLKTISKGSRVPIHQVRRPVRSLARKGLIYLERLFFEDEGLTAGSGYMVTPAGWSRFKGKR